MPERIYLDYNASTPIAPEVIEAMRPFFSESFGNPYGPHWAGVPAKAALQKARRQTADFLGCEPEEIVFTGCATEANNLAIKGVYYDNPDRSHIVTSRIEHPSVLAPCRFLERYCNAKVTYLPVDRFGRVDPQQVRQAITSKTGLITIMSANNEIGTLQPLDEIAAIAHDAGVCFHTDAAQTAGKARTRVDHPRVDLLTLAGHKVYAPKGVGALFVRKGVRLEPLIHGASQEHGLRAGTENLLLIVGFGKALELAGKIDDERIRGVRELRDEFWRRLHGTFGERVSLNGHPEFRLPNTLNVNFAGVIGGELLAKLDNVAASTGAACHSGKAELSDTLKAIGVPLEIGAGAIRFSLGTHTTRAEIETVIERLIAVYR